MPVYFIANKVIKNPILDNIFNLSPYLISILLFVCYFIFLQIKFRINYFILLKDFDFILELICLLFVLFTPITGDYYLLILLIPLVLINFNKIDKNRRIFYLILLLPKLLLIKGLTFSTFINPLIIIILIYFLYSQYSNHSQTNLLD
jgi:hypothetical protein